MLVFQSNTLKKLFNALLFIFDIKGVLVKEIKIKTESWPRLKETEIELRFGLNIVPKTRLWPE